MGFKDDISSMVNRGTAAAGRKARQVSLNSKMNELGRQRQALVAQLGTSLYEQVRSDPALREGRENLISQIEEVDNQRYGVELEQQRLLAESEIAQAQATVLRCAVCGAPIHATDQFCSSCGSPATEAMPTASRQPDVADGLLCPSCGAPISSDDVFCMSCGTRLDDGRPPASLVSMESAAVVEGAAPDAPVESATEAPEPQSGEVELEVVAIDEGPDGVVIEDVSLMATTDGAVADAGDVAATSDESPATSDESPATEGEASVDEDLLLVAEEEPVATDDLVEATESAGDECLPLETAVASDEDEALPIEEAVEVAADVAEAEATVDTADATLDVAEVAEEVAEGATETVEGPAPVTNEDLESELVTVIAEEQQVQAAVEDLREEIEESAVEGAGTGASGLTCPQCGQLVEPGDLFCQTCGHRLEEPAPESEPPVRFCMNCGAPVEPGFNFCGNCGKPI